MIPLARLKQEMEFIRGLNDIVDVLRTSSSIQFRASQNKKNLDERFLKEIEGCFLTFLSRGDVRYRHLKARARLPQGIVIVTSDEGFLGELNASLINAGMDLRKSRNDEIIVLGERGAGYLDDLDQKYTFFEGIAEELDYKQVQALLNYIVKRYKRGYSQVFIVYPEFVSLVVQKVKVLRLLPYDFPEQQEEDKLESRFEEEVLVEPSPERLLDVLIKLWMAFKLLESFIQAKQSEFAARIMHLERSSRELIDLNQQISLSYFKKIHNLSDKIIREVFAAKLFLAKR